MRPAARSRAGLVAVAIGDDPDPVPQPECVRDQPLEGAPARMHLDRPFVPMVVGIADVGVAPAHMGEADRIFLRGMQASEELARIPGIQCDVAMVRNERV